MTAMAMGSENAISWTRNGDRFLKCASCRATAAFVVFAKGVTVTTLYDHGPVTKPWSVSTCQRHSALNIRRAKAARTKTVDKRSAST